MALVHSRYIQVLSSTDAQSLYPQAHFVSITRGDKRHPHITPGKSHLDPLDCFGERSYLLPVLAVKPRVSCTLGKHS